MKRVVDSAGDNILAEFSGAVDAIRCAVEVQLDSAKRDLKFLAARHLLKGGAYFGCVKLNCW